MQGRFGLAPAVRSPVAAAEPESRRIANGGKEIMAHMIPDAPPEPGPGKAAESALFEALQSRLPDDFFVYHGARYLESEGAAEGEADFLILHREHACSLLSVECKGKGF